MADKEKMRKLIEDCQRDFAEYISPESGITEHQVLHRLMARLDGQQAKEALGDDWKSWWPDDGWWLDDDGDNKGSPSPQDRAMA